MSRIPYAVAIMKRAAECSENQGSGPYKGHHSLYSALLQQSGNIECTITGARCYSSDLPQVD